MELFDQKGGTMMLRIVLTAAVVATLIGCRDTRCGTGSFDHTIYVDHEGTRPLLPPWQRPFRNVPEALEKADTLTGSVVMYISPGRYEILDTLRVERQICIVGSTQPEYESSIGLNDVPHVWPTGNVVVEEEATVLVGGPDIQDRPLISFGKEDSILHDVGVKRIVFEPSGATSAVMDFKRVQNFQVSENIFRGPANEVTVAGVQAFGSSGQITDNYMTGMQIGAAIHAGTQPGRDPAVRAQTPAEVTLTRNRIINGRVGVFLVGTSDGISEAGNFLTAHVGNNDISGHKTHPNSAGIRILVKGNEDIEGDYGHTSLAGGTVLADIQYNRVTGNKFAFSLGGGFLPRGTVTTGCSDRIYSGALDISFGDNEVRGNASSVIAFTTLAAVISSNPEGSKYLTNSTYEVTDPNGALGTVDVYNPVSDPLQPSQDGCQPQGPLGNKLSKNGLVIDATP